MMPQVEYLPIDAPSPLSIGESHGYALVNRAGGTPKLLDVVANPVDAINSAEMLKSAYGEPVDFIVLAGRVRWHHRYFGPGDMLPLCVLYETAAPLAGFPRLKPGQSITVRFNGDADPLVRSVRDERGRVLRLTTYPPGVDVAITADELAALTRDWHQFDTCEPSRTRQ